MWSRRVDGPHTCRTLLGLLLWMRRCAGQLHLRVSWRYVNAEVSQKCELPCWRFQGPQKKQTYAIGGHLWQYSWILGVSGIVLLNYWDRQACHAASSRENVFQKPAACIFQRTCAWSCFRKTTSNALQTTTCSVISLDNVYRKTAARKNPERFHCNIFIAMNSLQWFTAMHSLQSNHQNKFTKGKRKERRQQGSEQWAHIFPTFWKESSIIKTNYFFIQMTMFF